MENKNSVYLGDIDPNNNLGRVVDVRRNILYKLLLWDSIVLSDSQFLTDFRILQMMEGFKAKVSDAKKDATMKEWHKGFELLLSNGMIEIAHRDRGDGAMRMMDLWKQMSSETANAKVPYLPLNDKYAKFLDKTVYNKRVYNLQNMAERFRNNLLKGIEDGVIRLNDANDVDVEFKRLINEKGVLFRDIFHLLRSQLQAGNISELRYNEMYRYVYGCYSTNVPAETDCFVCTDFCNIPFHLKLGFDVLDEEIYTDEKKLRKTWALDPTILDILSIESFIRIREKIAPCLITGILMKYKLGILESKELPEYYDIWEEYTVQLENAIKRELINEQKKIDIKIQSQYISAQERFKLEGVNLFTNVIKSVVSTIPPVGAIISAGDMIKDVKNVGESFIMMHKSQMTEYMVDHRNEVAEYLENLLFDKKIITKISK